MTRVILKPMGVVVLLVSIAVLVAIAITSRNHSETVAMAPNVTKIALANPKEAAVSDLINGDFSHAAPFTIRVQGLTEQKRTGAVPSDWSFNCWDKDSVAEAAVETNKNGSETALVIRNLSGKGSSQFYLWHDIPVEVGAKYRIRCEYQTAGDAALIIKSPGFADRREVLAPTASAWKTVEISLDRKQAGEISLTLQHYSLGQELPLSLRSVRIWKVGS